jgi:F-type H+-transporting ATPase subunit epsilon
MSSVSEQIQCVVVTPERTLFDESVEFVALPLYDGEIGIGPGRAPLIGRLGFGEMRTRQGGTIHRYFLDGGFAQVRDNVVTILTNRAIAAEKIDPLAASTELERAKTQPATTETEFLAKGQRVDRARAQVRISRKRV